MRNLRTQHATIKNYRTTRLGSTTKEIDSGVGQRAAINGQNWSQLVGSIQKYRTGITLAKAAVDGCTLKRIRKINGVVEDKIASTTKSKAQIVVGTCYRDRR
jgi:hypothetical protein